MEKGKIINELIKNGVDCCRVLQSFGHDVDHSKVGQKVRCMFHDDHNPSMLIQQDHIHCFGCKIHFDLVQIYAFCKTGNLDIATYIWESDELNDLLNDMAKTFDLKVSDFEGFQIESDEQFFFKQLKEMRLDYVDDFLYYKNPTHMDRKYQAVSLRYKAMYIYRDYITKEPLAVKVRYESIVQEDKILYAYKNAEFIETERVTAEHPLKRKSFRFFNIDGGKIINEVLPENKKRLIYNADKVYDLSMDEEQRNRKWVAITEGEKDADNLMEYGFTACSLMTGAGSKWEESYNDIFQCCNVIVFGDFDDHGMKYQSSLLNSLYGASTKWDGKPINCVINLKGMNRKFFEFNKMPHKSDITDLIEKWKTEGCTRPEIIEKINEIIARSINIKDLNEVQEKKDGIHLKNKKIADFHIIKAVNIISVSEAQSDMIELQIKGIDSKRMHTRIANVQEIFGSPDNFNKSFSKMDCTFLGGKNELNMLKKYIEKYDMFDKRYMYPANGMYYHNGEWVTITPEGSLKKNGEWDPDIFSSNEVCYPDLIDVKVPDADQVNAIGEAIFNFNTAEIVWNVLGETTSKLMNARYKKLGIKSNLFSLNGTKGAGKTETTVKIMATLSSNSTRGEQSLRGQTNFTFLKNVSANNIGGVIFQELKLSRMKDVDKNNWSEIFRNNYDRSKSQRGTKDQGLNSYDQLNPIIITGEEGISDESALTERFNIVFMTASDRNANPDCEANFNLICDSQEIIRGIGKQLIIDIMNSSDEDILSLREAIEVKMREGNLHKKGFMDRVMNNAKNTIHGATVFSMTMKKLGYSKDINLEEAFDSIINNYLENVLKVNESKANDDFQKMLVHYQKALDSNYYDKVVKDASNAFFVEDGMLWISPTKIRTVVVNFVQDCKIDIPILSDNEFRKNLKKAGYINETDRRKFNRTEVSGWYHKVNISEMRKLDLDYINDLLAEKALNDPTSFLTDEPLGLERCSTPGKDLDRWLEA